MPSPRLAAAKLASALLSTSRGRTRTVDLPSMLKRQSSLGLVSVNATIGGL